MVNVIDMPIKCPVAPLEFCFLADWQLRERGLRDDVELTFVTPLDGAFTKPIASAHLGSLLADRGIRVESEFATGRVDAAHGGCQLGRARDRVRPAGHDPVHGGPEYIARSVGLGDALGFVPADVTRSNQRPPRTCSRSATPPTCRPQGRVGHPLRGRDGGGEHRAISCGRRIDRRIRRPRELLHRDRLSQGATDRLRLRGRAAARPLPEPHVGPLPLLEESRLNHLAKLAFQSLYWHVLLPGRDIPGIELIPPSCRESNRPDRRIKEHSR